MATILVAVQIPDTGNAGVILFFAYKANVLGRKWENKLAEKSVSLGADGAIKLNISLEVKNISKITGAG